MRSEMERKYLPKHCDTILYMKVMPIKLINKITHNMHRDRVSV